MENMPTIRLRMTESVKLKTASSLILESLAKTKLSISLWAAMQTLFQLTMKGQDLQLSVAANLVTKLNRVRKMHKV